MEAPRYLHLKPGAAPPRLEGVAPFKAVVVVDGEVTPEWQALVSDWLIRSCVDLANLAVLSYEEISDDDFVMTTWHANESLQETFWFSERYGIGIWENLRQTHCVRKQSDRATQALPRRSRGRA